MIYNYRCLILILIIILLAINQTKAQTSAYHSIVFPYDVGNRHTMTFGGIISSNPDPISSIQLNSAGLAFYDQPLFFFNYSINTNRYNLDYEYEYLDDNKINTDLISNPGFLTVVLPIFISGKKIVISTAIQGIESPEIDVWNEFYSDQQVFVEHSRKGAVSKTDIAISGQPITGLGIGLGISKWAGNWTWRDQAGTGIIGQGKYNYSGTSFNIALLYQWSRYKFGLSLYSPFQLMTSSVIIKDFLYSFLYDQMQTQRDIEQRFDGAARFGFTYLLKPDLQIGMDYRWQDKISIRNEFSDTSHTSFTDKYSQSHQLSIAVGKDFNWHSLKLPVFIAYQMNLMPTTPENYSGLYQRIEINDENNIQHSIHSGVNLLYKSYGFYLTAQWKMGSVQIYDASNFNPDS